MGRIARLMAAAFFQTLRNRRRRGPLLPSWSFQFEWIITFLRLDWYSGWRRPLPELRAQQEKLALSSAALRKTTRAPAEVGGVPGVWFTPKGVETRGVLLFLHGGSYLFGSPRTHAELIARLCHLSKVRAFAPDYRLAPEHPYPAALQDALGVWRALAKEHGAQDLVVAGDSAGGNLALALCLALRDAGEAQPRGAWLISPWLDLESTFPSIQRNEPYDYGPREMLLDQARQFAGGLPLSDPRLSLVHAEVHGVAPLFVQAGTAECLHDECEAFVRRAREQGVDVTFDEPHELPHDGPLFAQWSTAAAQSTSRGADFLRQRFDP